MLRKKTPRPAPTGSPPARFDWQAQLRLLRPEFKAASGRLPNLRIEAGQWSGGAQAREEVHDCIEQVFARQDLIYRKRQPTWLFSGRLVCWHYAKSVFTGAACAVGHIGWWHQFQALAGAASGWLPVELCPEDWGIEGDRSHTPELRGVSGWVATIFYTLRGTAHVGEQALSAANDPLSPRMIQLHVDPFRASVFAIDLLTGSSEQPRGPRGGQRGHAGAVSGAPPGASDTVGNGPFLPDGFRWGTAEVTGLSLPQWKLLNSLCEHGRLRDAVATDDVICQVYGVDRKATVQIQAKRRALLELRRRTQEKLDAAKVRLVFDLTNENLRLLPIN